ncbi:U1 small nuclear ribonucleoprotein C [Candida viswanathii]|uniref:U1 small nuclear ribonucleoprotein C n=1 Tax=Candida viswanathii TaxID=5486 RepID=A0A367XPF6_9ASCO|nr:U1 small nuclear ribonucleoprotein C [Candida viswanathii]
MPKYYCDYCKSYLTHDTLSVRKSHLQGRNHIKLYCDYYELKAKETNIWNPLEVIYDITLDKIHNYENLHKLSDSVADSDAMDVDKKDDVEGKLANGDEEDEDEIFLPPPPSLIGLPNPPPAVYNNTKQYQKAIFEHTQKRTT